MNATVLLALFVTLAVLSLASAGNSDICSTCREEIYNIWGDFRVLVDGLSIYTTSLLLPGGYVPCPVLPMWRRISRRLLLPRCAVLLLVHRFHSILVSYSNDLWYNKSITFFYFYLSFRSFIYVITPRVLKFS